MANYDGTSGDDTYVGTDQADTINGNGGNDTLAGGGGGDTIDGGNGDDTLYSANISPEWKHSYYYIAPIVPILDTGSEVDTLRGGAGYDTIFAGYGDNVDGGADGARLLISLKGASAGVNVNFRYLFDDHSGTTLYSGTITIGGGTITNISAVAWVDGSDFDDVIIGSDHGGTSPDIRGLGGNDTLTAGYYTSNLYGGDGNDILYSSNGGYGGYYYGDAGNDTIYAGNASNGAFGGDGDDTINGSSRSLFGGAGNDTFNLTNSTNYAFGEDGNDTINGAGDGERLYGGAGADIIHGGEGNDALFSAGDTDPYTYALDRGADYDQLYGDAGDDDLYGGYGDRIDGGSGTNRLTLTLTGGSAGATVDGNAIIAGGATIAGGAISNIQSIARIDGTTYDDTIIMPTQTIAAEVHGDAGNDTISAGASALTFYGDAGDDTLNGGSGNDTFYGGAGADHISGGGGDDTIYATAAEIVAGESIDGGTGVDTFNISGGSNVTVDLSGMALANVEKISAQTSLIMASGQFAGVTNLTFQNLTISNGGTISLSGTSIGGLAVNLSAAGNTFDLTGATVYYGYSNFIINGGASGDVITGGSGNDTINGGGGNDTLNGGAGNDYLYGGTGLDILHGGDGNDSISTSATDFVSGEVYDGGDGNDVLAVPGTLDISSATLTSIETLGVDYFGGIALTGMQLQSIGHLITLGGTYVTQRVNLTTGGTFAYSGTGDEIVFTLANVDTMFSLSGMTYALRTTVNGGSGNDTITGSAFGDTLIGGTGRDELYGGIGNDTFTIAAGDVVAGEIYDGGTGNDTLILGKNVDISSATVTGIETVNIDWQGAASMTAAQLQGFSRISSSYYSPENINLTTGGAAGFAGSTDQQLVFNLAAAGTVFDLSGLTSTVAAGVKAIVTGGAGNDTITGSNYDDQLRGGGGLDVFHGGDGDDNIIVANGDYVSGEVYDGAAGRDSIVFSQTGSLDVSGATFTSIELLTYISNGGQLTVTPTQLLGFSYIAGQGTSAFTLTTGGSLSFAGKQVQGTFNLAAADTVMDFSGATISGFSITVNGNSGNDTMIGNASSADIFNGGAGDDRLDGRGGSDTLSGGLGDDTYVINSSQDVFFVNIIEKAGEGNDTIESAVSYSLNVANVENVKLSGTNNINATGDAGSNVLTGNSGNNRLDGFGGGDRMIGGLGNDTYIVRSSSDVIVEAIGGGTDTVQVASNVAGFTLAADAEVEKLMALTPTLTTAMNLTGNAFSHDIEGNAGDNILIGGTGADTLYGFAGNDSLVGGGGADTLIGGAGDDIYTVSDAATVVVEAVGEGNDTLKSSVSYVLGAGVDVETSRLIGTANIDLTGNADHQILIGNIANNVLDGGGGGDRMKGGAGDDTYIIRSAADVIVEIAGEGDDTVKAAVSYTLGAAAQIEHLTTIDALATTAINLTGNDYSHEIQGNAGVNVLTGGSGDDTISGNGGADTLIGGAGDDIYAVTDASTVIVESVGGGNDTIKAFVSYVLGAGVDVETSRLIGTANIDLTGNADHQILIGNLGNNTIDGGGGGDRMKGGAGDDTYIIRSSADVIVEIAGDGSDTVKAAVSYTLGAAAQIEHLRTIDASATTAIDLTGNDYSHDIQGNAGANVLTGGTGDDVLQGFAGNDTLIGGSGADRFVFDHGTGQDSVGDFVSGSDKLDLSAFGFADFAAVQAATHDVGGNAVIDLGGGDSVTLTGFLTAQLQSGDVILGSGSGGALEARLPHLEPSGVATIDVANTLREHIVAVSLFELPIL